MSWGVMLVLSWSCSEQGCDGGWKTRLTVEQLSNQILVFIFMRNDQLDSIGFLAAQAA